METPRERFTQYVRSRGEGERIISPFLPHPSVIQNTMRALRLRPTGDFVRDEIEVAHELGYEPMFMTDCAGLIFPWEIDESGSTPDTALRILPTRQGTWSYSSPRNAVPWNDEAACPVQTREDHAKLLLVCEEVDGRRDAIRRYFREWRERVGEDGVIVIGHPHPSWLGYQINPTNIFYQWSDWPEEFRRSMDALFEAALAVMSIAIEEGIDFMSDSSYGLEMTSPALFREMDQPYIRRFAEWTHERGGLFWYHNCGFTRQMIFDGTFDALGADLIETIAPPPEGDNDLRESRRKLSRMVCSKGNLNLRTLREGSAEGVRRETRALVRAVEGFPHIISSADAVLEGTPPENFIAFIETARAERGM